MSYLECYTTTRLNSERSFSHTDLGRLIYFVPKGYAGMTLPCIFLRVRRS